MRAESFLSCLCWGVYRTLLVVVAIQYSSFPFAIIALTYNRCTNIHKARKRKESREKQKKGEGVKAEKDVSIEFPE